MLEKLTEGVVAIAAIRAGRELEHVPSGAAGVGASIERALAIQSQGAGRGRIARRHAEAMQHRLLPVS